MILPGVSGTVAGVAREPKDGREGGGGANGTCAGRLRERCRGGAATRRTDGGRTSHDDGAGRENGRRLLRGDGPRGLGVAGGGGGVVAAAIVVWRLSCGGCRGVVGCSDTVEETARTVGGGGARARPRRRRPAGAIPPVRKKKKKI